MQNQSPATQTKIMSYLLPLGGIGIAIAIIPLTAMPLWENISTLRAEQAASVQKLSQLNEKLNQINQIKQDVAEYQVNFESLDRAYPSSKEVPALIVGIQKLAGEHEILIDSFQINPGEVVATESAKTASGSAEATPSATTAGPSGPSITTNVGSLVNPKDALLLELNIAGPVADQTKFVRKLSEIRRVMFIENISLNLKEDGSYLTKILIEVPYGGLPETLLAPEEPLPILSEEAKKTIADLEQLEYYTKPLTVTE